MEKEEEEEGGASGETDSRAPYCGEKEERESEQRQTRKKRRGNNLGGEKKTKRSRRGEDYGEGCMYGNWASGGIEQPERMRWWQPEGVNLGLTRLTMQAFSTAFPPSQQLPVSLCF